MMDPAPDLASTIALDGPAASGKSTVAKLLADQIGYLYFDTGVMYRAVTWAVLTRTISVDDEPAVTALAKGLDIDVLSPTEEDGRQYTVLVDGKDATWAIREAAVDASVSKVSAYPGVRSAMVLQQRRIAGRGCIVMVGRDIGTVVLPEADLKVYLDASPEERARRRWSEEQARGIDRELSDVLAEVRRRDRIDSTRKVAPLKPASDAIIIDSTSLSIEDVVSKILDLAQAPRD